MDTRRSRPAATRRAGLVWGLLACVLGGGTARAGAPQVQVVVVGPGAAPPARAWLRVELASGATRTTDVLRGYASVDAPPERARVLVFGAKDEAGRPLPWAPFRGVLEPGTRRLPVRMGAGLEIRGRVVDGAGVPVPGAAVAAHFQASIVSAEPAAAATTGADGTFALVGLGEEAYVVRARRAATDIGCAWAHLAGGARRALLTLPATRNVSLTIVDWRDRPVPGVSLGLYEVHGGAGDREPIAWTTTDARGEARWKQLDTTATYDLQVDAPEARDDLAELELRPWGAVDGRLPIPRGYVVTGTVRDATGRAVRANVVRHEPGGGWRSTPTEGDGTFRLTRVPYGKAMLSASPSDVTPAGFERPDATAGVEVTPERPVVTLVLDGERPPGSGAPKGRTPPTEALVVHVLAPDGSPIRDTTVSWMSELFATSTRVIGGTVEIATRGKEGTLRVFRSRDGEGAALPYGPAERDVDASTHEVTIRLEPGLTIEGRVLDEGGTPIPGVVVEAATGTLWGFGPDAESSTGDDGAFRLVGLGRREYQIRIPRPPAPWAAPPELPSRGGAKDLVLRLRRGEAPLLVVLDFEGRPLDGATVVLYEVELRVSSVGSCREKSRTRTDAKGGVRLPPTDPTGPLYLRIEPPQDRDDLRGSADGSGKPVPWNPKSGPIRLARGFTATGIVRDASGKPKAAPLYRNMTPEELDGSEEGVAYAGESDSNGAFRLRGLPYGPIRLWAAGSLMTFSVPDRAKLVTPEKPTVELTAED